MDSKTLFSKVALETGMDIATVQSLVDTLVATLTEVVAEGDSVAIPGFGSFETRKRMERVSQNPATGKRMLVPPKIVLGFRPSAVLKNRINYEQ